MSYLDIKYINLISSRLTLFSKKKADLFNFRCPYCGDSKKRRNKARGYLFKIKNNFTYKCHNCGVGRSLANFLKDHDHLLYDQYIMEKFKEGSTGKGTATPNPKFKFRETKFVKRDTDLERISDLNISHPARAYLEKRSIKNLDYFYYCPKFKEWTNKQKKTFDTTRQDSPRIIIPFKDKQGNLFGYQGRSLAPKAKLRYITIMLDEEQPKIFGLDRINTDETIYIVEGPFDSTFIKNSVAMCGSDIDIRTFGWSDYIWVFDNEPRNREIVNRISKTIDRGDKVIIWPDFVEEKDINDMVQRGHNVSDVLKSCTYSGLEAKVKFNIWKKV